MMFRKNKVKTYKYLPPKYEKTYFEDGVRKATLFVNLARQCNIQVIVETTEIHTYGCNAKGKFIELPTIFHRKYYIVGGNVDKFDDTLLLNYKDKFGHLACERVYFGTKNMLIGIG